MGRLNRGISSLAQTHYFRSQEYYRKKSAREWKALRWTTIAALVTCIFAARNCQSPQEQQPPQQDPRPAPTDQTGTPTDSQSLRRVLPH